MKKQFFVGGRYFLFLVFGALISSLYFLPMAHLQTSRDNSQPFPIKRQESAETWRRDGEAAIERAKNSKKFNRRAKM